MEGTINILCMVIQAKREIFGKAFQIMEQSQGGIAAQCRKVKKSRIAKGIEQYFLQYFSYAIQSNCVIWWICLYNRQFSFHYALQQGLQALLLVYLYKRSRFFLW